MHELILGSEEKVIFSKFDNKHFSFRISFNPQLPDKKAPLSSCNLLNADNEDILYLAYGAAENVLEYDKLNYMEDVLRFLESLNWYIDRRLFNSKSNGFNMISSSVNIIRGLRKETD